MSDQRVLILAPTGCDAELISKILDKYRIASFICGQLEEVFDQMGQGAACVLLAQEAIFLPVLERGAVVLAQQPSWSDFPFIILTANENTSRDSLVTFGTLQKLRNVSILERPLHPITLISAVQTALRARQRQYATRDHMVALQMSELKYRSLVAAMTAVVWNVDPQGRFVTPQPSWETFTAQPWSAYKDMGWLEMIHPEDRPAFMERWQKASEAQGFYEYPCRVWHAASQQYRYMNARAVAVLDTQNRIAEWIGTLTDIHERHLWEEHLTHTNLELEQRVEERTAALAQKEKELNHAQKIEAIGRLAGGVAHDFNNLVTGILGVTEDVHSTLPLNDPRREELQEVVKACKRAFELTRQLLAFGRQQTLQPIVLDLNQAIEETSKLLRRLIGEDIQLDLQFHARTRIKMDPGQLQQILMNLAVNARDAMPQGGRITVRTKPLHIKKQGQIAVLIPGPYIVVEFQDTGCGMDPDIASRIFEPFFTTKPLGKGTGLGLAVVYGIVEQSGGTISVFSTPNKGTTFKIILPEYIGPISEEQRGPDRLPTISGNETILLVEDEGIVRRAASIALRRRGYQVLEAHNADEAIQLFNNDHDQNIDLLLTDVVMPGLSGPQLAKQLCALRPSLKVLYMSGYHSDIYVEKGMKEFGHNFMEKTFTPNQLCHKVRLVLNSPERSPIMEPMLGISRT